MQKYLAQGDVFRKLKGIHKIYLGALIFPIDATYELKICLQKGFKFLYFSHQFEEFSSIIYFIVEDHNFFGYQDEPN